MLYFAFGMNMEPGHMARLCPGIRAAGVARLPDHRFAINRRGFATVIPQTGETVHGVLWLAADRHVRALDAFEGVEEKLYTRRFLQVTGEGDSARQALVYVACDAHPGKPAKGYLDIIVKGARHFNLPADYTAVLERHPSLPIPSPK